MGALVQGLWAAAALVLGVWRTLLSLVGAAVSGRPARIDLPIPGFPIDLVVVSKHEQIQVLKGNADIGRLHEVPTKDLPKWVQKYFASTQFYDAKGDHWFLPFDGKDARYPARREAVAAALQQGYHADDVAEIARMLRSRASDEDLSVAMVAICPARFLTGNPVPKNVTLDARGLVNSPIELLKPGKYSEATKGAQAVVQYCANHQKSPGMVTIDISHNIGATVNGFVPALRTLQKSPGEDIAHLFTRRKNCPTKSVARVALTAGTFGGLLAYPATPGKTVFFMSVSKAADATGNLFYTFGTGDHERACPLKPFFESFMGDLQQLLLSGSRGRAE